MDTTKIPFEHLQNFRYAKNRKFCENVGTASAESIFTVYGKMFSSFVCYSVTDRVGTSIVQTVNSHGKFRKKPARQILQKSLKWQILAFMNKIEL